MNKFSNELKHLKQGITVLKEIVVQTCSFNGDSPARAFVQQVKGHASYHACSYCRIVGVYSHHKMIFPYNELLVCRNYERKETNVIDVSPLSGFANLYADFPPDYLHVVCLGVVKRLLHYFFTTTLGMKQCYLTSNLKVLHSEKVNNYKDVLPREFQRRIRGFNNLSYFKGT